MSEVLVSRRDLLGSALKLAVIAGGMALTGKSVVEIGALGLEKLAEGQRYLPDYLLRPIVASNDSEEAGLFWQRTYFVRDGDTISGIASRVYPDFNKNQPFFTDKLRYANGQNKKKNILIYPGQQLYIPNPGVPTLGFAEGEEAFLLGQPIDGKYWPTRITRLNPKDNKIGIYFYNGEFETPIEVGNEFATDRPFRIAAVLEGASGFVPPRVVLELI